MSLAAKLKALRIRHGVSLQALADSIGASKTHVWDLETGRSDNPSIDLVGKLAGYFRVSISDLVGENPNAPGEDAKYVALYRDLKGLSPRDLDVILGLVAQLKSSGERMSEHELASTQRRDQNARASLAIEGMHATAEQEALFSAFDSEKLSHADRRKILAERSRKRASKSK